MIIEKCEIQEDGSYHCVDNNNINYGIQPNDEEALERFGVQAWIDAGNTPTPYTAPKVRYQDKRVKAYGRVKDQLDMQYWDAVNGTTVWKDHVAKVKSDIPKE